MEADIAGYGSHAVYHRDGFSLCMRWWLCVHRTSFLPNMGQESSTVKYLVLLSNAMVETAQLHVRGHFRPMHLRMQSSQTHNLDAYPTSSSS